MVARGGLGGIETMRIFARETWRNLWQRYRALCGYEWHTNPKKPVGTLDIFAVILGLFLAGILYLVIRYIVIDGVRHFLAGTSTFLFQ